ncbi:MAG: hypothetical protein PF488_04760 [Patescibacteria group bacterium]|jgi:hypothetical protein|nr:hypothetical protein [Patescibacteria group bacterium]
MENNLVNGLFAKKRDNAPDFVIANLSFNESIIDWLKNNFNEKGWCNADLLISKNTGKMYAKKNDWKPNAEQTNTQSSVNEVQQTLKSSDLGEEMPDEINNIPF